MVCLSRYVPSSMSYWQGRSDTLPLERFFQWVECCDLRQNLPWPQTEHAYAIIGFCSDEGVRRNAGRPGAALAPALIRQALGRLAVHWTKDVSLIDVGDVVCVDGQLEASQSALQSVVSLVISQGYKPIVLGGGHETAYGHFQGIKMASPGKKMGIINFDAHFDLRIPHQNQSTSGTPFYQISEYLKKEQEEFDYLCLGIQRSANTDQLFQTAESLAVNYIFANDIHQQHPAFFYQDIDDFIQMQEGIYLSFCMDVLAQSVAPGVSAPQAFGLYPTQVLPLIERIIQSKKVVAFDLVEVCPAQDVSGMTVNLAAQLIWMYFYYLLN